MIKLWNDEFVKWWNGAIVVSLLAALASDDLLPLDGLDVAEVVVVEDSHAALQYVWGEGLARGLGVSRGLVGLRGLLGIWRGLGGSKGFF